MTMKVKLNYHGLIEEIDNTIMADSIEEVRENMLQIKVGLTLLNSYMEEIADRAIETYDDWIVMWCKSLMLVEEIPEEGKDEQS